MKWQEESNMVTDENGRLVCMFPDDADKQEKVLVKRAPEMFQAINEYVDTIESGEYAGKKTFNKFKSLLDKIYEE
jgi:hypothetical protein